MRDDLDRLIDELEAERPGLRARIEAALAVRLTTLCRAQERRVARDITRALRSRGLSVRDAAALLGITPAGLKLHDDRLCPARDSSGRRTYERAAVIAFRDERARSRRRRAS